MEPLGKIKGTEVEVPSTNKSTSLLKNSVPSKYSITSKDSNVNYVNTDNKGREFSTQQNINNDTLSDENIRKYILPEIEERYKNESKEKITETLEELKSQKSKIDIETDEGIRP